MGRAKNDNKQKVHLRIAKLANGCKRYYLDYIYKGKRYREYLTDCTLKPARTARDRALNTNVRTEAQARRNAREQELFTDEFITARNKFEKLLLVDYLKSYENLKAEKGQSISNAKTVKNLILHIKAFRGEKTTMAQVDEKFCNDFIDYLATAKAFGINKIDKASGKRKPLSKTTARLYYNTFVCALNRAVKDGVISFNPTTKIDKEDKKPIKADEEERAYLTVEEVKQLIKTPYCNKNVKNAFLFACFCGLRISDIMALKWRNIISDGKNKSVIISMKKTGTLATIPLNSNALEWLPKCDSATDNDFIFTGLPVSTTINKDIKQWAKNAGIKKNICFHVSRHTFATLTLTSGVDIATVSSLLGHKNIRTTEIYAKVVDKKKEEAVNKLANMFSK